MFPKGANNNLGDEIYIIDFRWVSQLAKSSVALKGGDSHFNVLYVKKEFSFRNVTERFTFGPED